MGRADRTCELGIKGPGGTIAALCEQRNVLQQTRFTAAANGAQLPLEETNPYSHSYSRARVNTLGPRGEAGSS
jgi:hypothetical protein